MVTVNIDNLVDGQGLPVSRPAGMWVTVDESPAVVGVAAALETWLSNLSPVDANMPVSVRSYVEAATQPIGNLRAELALFGFPSGEFLGETFERRVGARKLDYFQRRNTESLLVELAGHAEFRYVLSWTPETGQRTALNVCVTPTVLLTGESGWAEFVRTWLEWSYPYFSDGGIVVTLCPVVRATAEYAASLLTVYQGIVSYG